MSQIPTDLMHISLYEQHILSIFLGNQNANTIKKSQNLIQELGFIRYYCTLKPKT